MTESKSDSRGYAPRAVAGMIVGTTTLEPTHSGAGFQVVSKARGAGGNSVSRIVDVLKKRDRPDARPPAVCKDCFVAWTHAGRPKLVCCKHNGVAALRRGGQWSVATLTPMQMATLARGGSDASP